MEFTGQRNEKQPINNSEEVLNDNNVKEGSIDKFLVRSKQPLIKKIFVYVINIFMWLYMLVVVYFFISACFNYNDYFIGILKISFKITNYDIRMFLLSTFIFFIIFFVGLLMWKYYNKNRFGKLNRRAMPNESTDDDMLALNLIDPNAYELLKYQKVIIFEKNPIKEL
ncbi:biofilm PGA synthesis protein PgaD [Sedimentibacter acidaminivorans]|uniref:Biofilm PGA synthesis protein PgaD n=1 Tax=Sedimentibacter acidaminivorans TaxID=913099 RepID=A0ABS4GBN8_9FIRM|nr:hypothetical protein [Sedimentibacter acidaminivorans]MBP1925090.1 biofilm PGA synthesis protein PgaD [Sedimentibacter acidaminivorans]